MINDSNNLMFLINASVFGSLEVLETTEKSHPTFERLSASLLLSTSSHVPKISDHQNSYPTSNRESLPWIPLWLFHKATNMIQLMILN